MSVIGKTSEELAAEFVSRNPQARLGSKTPDGLRRVVCDPGCKERDTIVAAFEKIAHAQRENKKKAIVDIRNEPLPCIHRGSQRHTCCGSPEMWICRHHKQDCVADESSARKLQSMVATPEAVAIKVCSTCPDRPSEETAIADTALWTPAERVPGTTGRVGFLSAAYMPIGGTETFHRSLLPRLKATVDIAGFVATGFPGGDGGKLQVPYATGINAARRIAAHCDIVVVWGINSLAEILPEKRPKVIAVHHSDLSSDWNTNVILNKLDLIDEIVCVNESTAKRISSCGKPTYFIPNAIDPDRLIPSGEQSGLRSRFGIPADSRIVLFGHRLSSEKRPNLAVNIARQLPAGWTMVIAGDGPERDSVKELSSGCDRVRIVGECSSLADWLSISSCFLSLSTYEGFGLAIGEAMAAGVPTVSTPTGIASGLATTLLADSTPKEWVDAIVNATVCVQPEVIVERFSVQRMVSQWQDVLSGFTGS